MTRTRVQSSNIDSIGYAEDSETLEIEFLGGSVYQYYNVPATEYAGFVNADSQGKYFHRHIKGQYEYSRV